MTIPNEIFAVLLTALFAVIGFISKKIYDKISEFDKKFDLMFTKMELVTQDRLKCRMDTNEQIHEISERQARLEADYNVIMTVFNSIRDSVSSMEHRIELIEKKLDEKIITIMEKLQQ